MVGRGNRLTKEELKASGTYRPGTHDKLEPTPEPELIDPSMPDELTSCKAQETWKELMNPDVCEPGWFHQGDRPAIISYCLNYARMLEAFAHIHENGETDDEGKQSTESKVADKTIAQHFVNAKHLGLTPTSMRSVGIDKDRRQRNKGLASFHKPKIMREPPTIAFSGAKKSAPKNKPAKKASTKKKAAPKKSAPRKKKKLPPIK